jgi:capsular exopolysaccharide synthesis family protein
VDLRRQIAIVRAWFPLLVACVILAAGAAFVFSSLQQKVYEAKATLIVGQSLSSMNPSTDQLLASQRLSTTYASVVTTRPILDNVITKLGLNVTADELRGRVVADTPQSNTLLAITARDTDPTRAAAIANALADQLIAASSAIQGRQAEFQASIDADLKATQDQINSTQAQVETLTGLTNPTAAQEAELATLDDRLASLRSTYATLLSYSPGSGSSLLSVIEPAVAPTSPVSPRPLLYTLMAATVGLLLGAAIAFVMEYLDDSVKDSDTVQEITGLSTLGTISRMKGDGGRNEIYRIVTLLYPRSSVAEAYRTLRTNIEFASVDAPIRTLLVTSSISGEGKTVTAANLALVFAQAGRRVLLVDADLRKPGVHLVFDLPNLNGLTTLLRSLDASLDAVVHGTEQENLRILTTGPLPPNPAELLGSRRMLAILDRLKATGDLVILDSPPLQEVTDSAILSSYSDATLFVIDAGRSHRGTVRQGREALAKAGAVVLGVVLNRTHGVRLNYGGYYVEGRVPDAAADKHPPATEKLPKGSFL